jgi:hypothetical protein
MRREQRTTTDLDFLVLHQEGEKIKAELISASILGDLDDHSFAWKKPTIVFL